MVLHNNRQSVQKIANGGISDVGIRYSLEESIIFFVVLKLALCCWWSGDIDIYITAATALPVVYVVKLFNQDNPMKYKQIINRTIFFV